jgi:signal transduction histidine kinase/CheY-like chemotaxis protein
MRGPLVASGRSVIAVAIMLALVLGAYVPWHQLAWWLAGVAAAQFLPGLLYFRVWPDRATTRQPRMIGHYYVAAAAISGGYWGLSLLAFLDPRHPEIQFFVALTLGGIATANVAAQAFHPPMMRPYLVLLVLPFAAWCLLQPDTLNRYLGAGMVLLVCHLYYFAHFHTRTLRRSIELRHENARLVEELQQKAAALEEAGQAKSRFFAAASHDLRQPLHALGYYTSLLQPHEGDAPHVERVEQCIASLDDLLEGVLDISRLDAGHIQPQPGPVALHALLGHLGTLYGGAALAKRLRLKVHAPPLWAHTDAALLERVLVNLLGNALRYTEQGGVLLAARPAAGGIRLQVIDSGIGIAPEATEQIFEEFVQLHNPERDPSRGVGLGLATVRRLCGLLGHAVHVRSVPGRGSCFELHLPRVAAPAVISTPQAEAADTAPLAGRALVVDDHALVRDSLVQTLAGWGLQCDSAADGPQALALARQHRYDAVLCDWRLPQGLDGVQLLAQIRALQPTLELAVLVTGETEASLGAVPAGIPVLRKPIRPIRLRALLSAHLAQPAETG